VTQSAALLFDLDGALIDSGARHMAVFQRMFALHGIALDQPGYSAILEEKEARF